MRKMKRRGIALALTLYAGIASASEPDFAVLDKVFARGVDVTATVPATDDTLSVIQLRVRAPENIRNPGLVRIVANDAEYLVYHYAGYADGEHSYLVGVPNSYSGNVNLSIHLDPRTQVADTYSRTRDDLLKNTVLLGANDIVLLVDISGSMGTEITGGTRMKLAQDVVNAIGPQLEAEGNNVAVVQYGSAATVRLALDTKFSPLTFAINGGTYTNLGIAKAIELLNGRPSRGKIIIDITDGVPSDKPATEAEVNKVIAKAGEGWAFAGIGMGTQVPSYYPIRQSVTNADAHKALEGALTDLIKTAEEQVRDVDSICSGDRCATLANDTEPPVASIETVSQCATAVNGSDFRITLRDQGLAGIDTDKIKLQVDFGDAVFDLPFSIQNYDEINTARAAGHAPSSVVLASAAGSDSEVAEYFRRANFQTEDEGGRKRYTLKVSAYDMDGHELQHDQQFDPLVREDSAAPDVSILTADGGDTLRYAGDLSLSAEDDKTGMNSALAQIALVFKGERLELDLAPTTESAPSTDLCVSRYPLKLTYSAANILKANPKVIEFMGAAFQTGEPLTVEAEFVDFAKNRRKVSREIKYEPETVNASAVRVPGLAHQFGTANGRPPVQVDAADAAYFMDKRVRYAARLQKDTDALLNVNGKPVTSSAFVDLGEFELADGASIDLELASTGDRVNGEATLLLMPSNEYARPIRVPVSVWMPDLQPTSKNFSPAQLFERVQVGLDQANASGCRLTGLEEAARDADPVNDPRCLIEWTVLPTDTYGVKQAVPELTGFIPQPGQHAFGYRAKLFDTDGTEFVVGEGQGLLDVVPAKDVMTFGLGKGLDNTYRVVRKVTGRLQQTGGPACSSVLTNDEMVYSLSAMNRPACHVEWKSVPEGISGLDVSDVPTFNGAFNQRDGDGRFAWTISSYSTSGERIHVMDGEQVVSLQSPPAPEITIDDKQKVRDGLYWAQQSGGAVGDYRIRALNAPLEAELHENGDLKESEDLASSTGEYLNYRSRIITGQAPLWSKTPVRISARYADLPDVASEQSFELLSVPDLNIKPNATVAETSVLNTSDMVVSAAMIDPFDLAKPFDPSTMGEWEIRLLNYISTSRQEPLSEYKVANAAGGAEFPINLKALTTSFIRVLPEARLISKEPGYERTVLGARPIYVTVLRGEAIEASLSSRRLAGEAPLALSAKIELKNMLDFDSIGEVVWEVRSAGASDWQSIPGNPRSLDRLAHTFDAGQYELKATIVNKNSGERFVTESIQIHAFSIPQVQLEGPDNAFMGDTAKVRLKASLPSRKNPQVEPGEMEIEWSEDGGSTWAAGGETYSLTRSGEDRVFVQARARMKDSPANMAESWSLKQKSIAFRPVMAPGVTIYGARTIELGKPVNWRGMISAPYPNMDVTFGARFILPDGSSVETESVEYMPTREDASKQQVEVSYEAWIEGFKGKGAHTVSTRKISVWEYEWPAWEFYTQLRQAQAPASLSISVRNPKGSSRYIEDLRFDWELPNGVEVVESKNADGRVIAFKQGGEYPIKVKISDARGHETELVYEAKIEPAATWDVGFRLSKSNPDNRSPLDLRFIPDVSGGHPLDRVTDYRYIHNGKVISEGQRYASLNLGEGTHEIGLEIVSAFGEVVRHTERIEVLPNIPPTCSLSSRESGGNWRFQVVCEDKDGYIAEHRWELNGEQLGVSGSRISVSAKKAGSLAVRVEAIDNGGASSEPIHWNSSAGDDKK